MYDLRLNQVGNLPEELYLEKREFFLLPLSRDIV